MFNAYLMMQLFIYIYIYVVYFMFYFTCSPEHKTFHFFTGLNNKDKILLGWRAYKTVELVYTYINISFGIVLKVGQYCFSWLFSTYTSKIYNYNFSSFG